ncbi:MAG: adenylate/guanylate cyclase domain-containing protein [Anaerolineae bacterium]
MPDLETGNLPEDLERFLPPRLWQSLTAGTPRRGLLLNALDRLRSILYLLSTYLPGELVQQKMRRPIAGQVRGQMLDGSLLFSDVSGFTALSERLARTEGDLGAEQLTALMNDYFARMLRIIAWSGGCLLKFAGDALLVYFPWQEGGQQAAWAVRAALRMMDEMGHYARSDGGQQSDGGASPPPLRMKIGVGSGPFLAASVGSAERMEYVVLGEPVERTMAAEGQAQAGQVIVDGATAARLPDLDPEPLPSGFFLIPTLCAGTADEDEVRALDDFEIKVERRRGRGAVPLSASSHAVAAQMEIVLRQIEALVPFLAPELTERIVAGARQRRVAGEFRPTTVLFANFTGVEALLAPDAPQPPRPGLRPDGRAAANEATRVLDEYFQTMEGIIRRHGGVVSRIDPYRYGSKMLVLFGAPVAHEDDPLRAVSAALAMNEELAALNARWRRRHTRRTARRRRSGGHEDGEPAAPHLQHSIGITRGMTFAGEVGSPTRREYTVMGDDVNLAARLMAAGQAGQILISQRVYDAVAEHLAATALPAIRVKGKSQPIPIYQPLGPRDDPLARRLQQRKRLLAREAETERGRQAVRQALAGQGRVLRISGPAGIGKSHLADELVTYALARAARLMYVPCHSYQAGAPYAPWIPAIRRLAAMPTGAGPEAARDHLLARLRAWGLDLAEYGLPLCTFLGLPSPPLPTLVPDASRAPAATDSAPGDGSTPGGGPTLFARLQDRVEQGRGGGTQTGLWQLMRQRRQAQPGSLWGSLQARVAARQEERLHCAICALLGRAASEAPLLILLEDAHWLDSASQGLLDDLARRIASLPILVLVVGRQENSGDGLPAHDHLALRPLDLAGTAALVGSLMEEAGVAVAPAPEIIEQIHCQSDGNPLFIEEMVAAVQRAGGPQGQASASLQDLVLSHVDTLPTGQREISRVASVAGTDFRRGAIAALLSADLGKEEIDRHLAGLEEQRLILLGEGAPGNGRDATYLFRQALVRDVIYHSLSLARRRELHAGHASYLETWPGIYRGLAAVLDLAELLAHHYELGGHPLPAAHYLLLSAHKARERYAYGQARAFYGRALAALDELQAADPAAARLRAAAHQGQGDVALLAGDFGAALAAYEAAITASEAARTGPGGTTPPRLEARLALVLPTQGRAAEAEALARRLWVGQDGRHLDGNERLATAATLAWLLWRREDAEAGDCIARGRALLAGEAAGHGPWQAGIAALFNDLGGDWSAAQRAYRALDRPAGIVLAACRQGDRHLAGGDEEAALALFAQAADVGEKEQDAQGLALARYCQARGLARGDGAAAAKEMLTGALDLLHLAEDAAIARTERAGGDGGDQPGRQLDSQVVQRALDALRAGGDAPWPPWRWQAYDDALRISLIFYAGDDPEDLIPERVRMAQPSSQSLGDAGQTGNLPHMRHAQYG